MRRLAEGILLTLLLCLGASPVQGQEAGERRVIPVSVIDHEGKVVEGLTAADFRGSFRSRPVKIVSVEWDTGPRRIALLVDTSAGMGKPMAKMQLAWWAAGEAAARLPKSTSLALLTFDMEVKRYTDPTTNQASLVAAFLEAQRRAPSGGTTLFDGIWEAARALLPPGFGHGVFVLSDGEDTYSRVSREQVASALAEVGIRVHFFVVSGRAGKDRKDALSGIRTIADATGGRIFELFRGRQETAEIATRLTPFFDSMTWLYRMEIELPVRVDKVREWKLHVVGEQGEARQDVEVAYPRLLVPLESEKKKKKKE